MSAAADLPPSRLTDGSGFTTGAVLRSGRLAQCRRRRAVPDFQRGGAHDRGSKLQAVTLHKLDRHRDRQLAAETRVNSVGGGIPACQPQKAFSVDAGRNRQHRNTPGTSLTCSDATSDGPGLFLRPVARTVVLPLHTGGTASSGCQLLLRGFPWYGLLQPKRGSQNVTTIPAETPQLLTSLQVCQMLRVSRQSLWRLQKRGEFPVPVKPLGGNRLRWRKSEIESFINQL